MNQWKISLTGFRCEEEEDPVQNLKGVSRPLRQIEVRFRQDNSFPDGAVGSPPFLRLSFTQRSWVC